MPTQSDFLNSIECTLRESLEFYQDINTSYYAEIIYVPNPYTHKAYKFSGKEISGFNVYIKTIPNVTKLFKHLLISYSEKSAEEEYTYYFEPTELETLGLKLQTVKSILSSYTDTTLKLDTIQQKDKQKIQKVLEIARWDTYKNTPAIKFLRETDEFLEILLKLQTEDIPGLLKFRLI